MYASRLVVFRAKSEIRSFPSILVAVHIHVLRGSICRHPFNLFCLAYHLSVVKNSIGVSILMLDFRLCVW